MKRIVALLLAVMMVMSLAACGGNTNTDTDKTAETTSSTTANNKSTEPQVSGCTYVFESMTENGQSVAEDMLALYTDSKYAFNADGTCAYTMSMFGTNIETKGTYTQNGSNVTVVLDYGDEGTVEIAFVLAEDVLTFTEEIDGTVSAQTYKKQA